MSDLAIAAIFADAQRAADARLTDVVLRALDWQRHCDKCGQRLREYVRAKLALHHARKRWRDGNGEVPETLTSWAEQTRAAFHDSDCVCGERTDRSHGTERRTE